MLELEETVWTRERRLGVAYVVGLLCLGVCSCGSRSGLLSDLEPGGPETLPLGVAPPDAPEPVDVVLEPTETLTGCVDISRSYASVPPTVMLLIDQSASMDDRFGDSTRWAVLRDAIVNPDDGLLGWLDPSASIGLMLYTSLDGYDSGRGCPMVTHVAAALGSAERIRDVYLAAEPLEDGDTPTAEGIDEAVLQLNQVPGAAAKYILLLTDGIPDTCAVPDPQDGLGAAIEAVERAFLQGIRVHTVGVSPEISRSGLQWMANAAAGKPARGLVWGRDADAEEPLYASTDPRELAAQLRGIIGDVRTCTIELDEKVGLGRAFEGRLVLDGTELEYGARNGWSFVDDDTLEVHGTSCERILGEGQRLQVTFPCVSELSLR